MEDNDRVIAQRMVLTIKKLRQIAAYFSSGESMLVRKLLRHIEEMEREIKQSISA